MPSPRRIGSPSAGRTPATARCWTFSRAACGWRGPTTIWPCRTIRRWPSRRRRRMWNIQITPQIDGKPFAKSRWTRLDGVLPALENVYEDAGGYDAVGGHRRHDGGAGPHRDGQHRLAAAPVRPALRFGQPGARIPPGSIRRSTSGDNLVAGWNDRADRVLVLGIGADAYSLQPDGLRARPQEHGARLEPQAGRKTHGLDRAALPRLRGRSARAAQARLGQGDGAGQEGMARSARPGVETEHPRRRRDQRLSGLPGRSVHHARADERRL